MQKKILAVFLAISFVFISGAGCKITNKGVEEAAKPITLNYWRVFDGEDDFTEMIAAYKALYPHITINYRLLRYDEYENEILNALAEDRGPDIFSIHNTWVKKYQNKLAPMPPVTTMVSQKLIGSIKKELVSELTTANSLTLKSLKDNFAEVVYNDVVIDNQIYGLPLSVDTLAMYYNRDLLNNAGIVQLPVYWNRDFLITVNKLTRLDSRQGIVQSGAALGGAYNISRSPDILAALMMQNGAVMESNGVISFNQVPAFAKETGYNPGLEALRFYSDFANPIKESYTWNEELNNSLDMFISGNLAIMFTYSYDIETIKSRAPKLNFSVTNLPQIEGNPPTNINFANYWLESVSNKSKHQNEAWNFIQFITKAENVKSYLEKTNKPTALKILIPEQLKNDEIGIFASQILTAKSWYQGMNPQAAETAIREMVLSVVNNPSGKIQDIINITATRIQQTIK